MGLNNLETSDPKNERAEEEPHLEFAFMVFDLLEQEDRDPDSDDPDEYVDPFHQDLTTSDQEHREALEDLKA